MFITARRDEYDIKDDADFKKRVLENKKPVVVDFHAVWCGPCRDLAPKLSKIVNSRDNKVDLAKVNIDHHQELAVNYGVAAVPTVMLMKDGKMITSFLGLISDKEIEDFVPKE
uniref:Thioredoxin n=1 Tax=Amphimedon queenslandica TaxID=400682 RepID=A0A1X7UXY4_AMPQE